MNRRTSTRTKVDVLINRFVDGHPYMCRMTDISPTGLRLVPLLEPRNSRSPKYMGLQFQLPGTDIVLTASAVAVEGGGAGTGVRFTSLAPESASLIRQFVDRTELRPTPLHRAFSGQ